MASLGELVVKIGADTRGLNKQLGKVQRELRGMTSNITQLGQNLTRNITLPLAALGAAAVKSAADLETLEVSFISLTGGAKQARDMVQQLNKFTAETPFQLEQVGKAARQLIAAGTGVEDVADQLQFLGDIAATSGTSIDEIAAIFAKVQAKGKVELENLNQLAERGIPIFTALSEATGLPAAKLGAGAVSVEQFNETLKSFAAEGGFAAGAMERLSQTVTGKFSTALDNAKLAAASLGAQLLPLISKALDRFTALAQQFSALDASVKQTILGVAAAVASFGPLLTILPKIVQAITLIASPAGTVVLAIGAIATAVFMLYDDIRPLLVKVANLFINLYNNILPLRIQIQLLAALFKNAADIIKTAFFGVLDTFKTLLATVNKLFEGDYSGAFDTLKEGMSAVKDDVVETATNLGKDVVEGLQEAIFGEPIQLLSDDVLPTKAEIQAKFASLFAGAGQVVTDTVGTEVTENVNDLLGRLDSVAVKAQTVAAETTSNFRDMTAAMADAFGNAAASAESFAGFAIQAIKGVILAYLAEAKTRVIANAAEASAGTGPAFPFVMAGLIGAGMALINKIPIPALAEGGLASGPTMAIVGDNRNAAIDPEVISPLSKLKDMMGGSQVEVFGRISGNDIFLSNSRSGFKRNRYS